MKDSFRTLTEEERRIIELGETEPPFSGEYTDQFQPGIYHCKRCDAPLFSASAKFHSGCGWPSFDESLENRVQMRPDPDGRRTEIICANCQAHLGHVFYGEGFTPKNTRHCVNSLSLIFKPEPNNV